VTRRRWIVDLLARLANDFKEEITDETSLTDEGLGLDSLALADLVSDIERGLSIQVREEDIGPDTFGTVGRLIRFIESRELQSHTLGSGHPQGPLPEVRGVPFDPRLDMADELVDGLNLPVPPQGGVEGQGRQEL
jgi:acyl carrier protein